MEKLKNMYLKDIEREIQGVIKVDDESYISQELDEYVVTEELLRHFNSFFSSYNSGINKHNDKMGVWISGFFGSGKSHFLKILSYLLENKVVDGKHAVDYFDNKIEDKMLLANIKRAGSNSTDVILFNIDSKTENTNGVKDKILDVFEKVFNEKLGLSITPFVAEIERFIIAQGKYEEFKNEFKNVSGSSWEDMRDGIQFVQDEFSKAYSKALNKTIEESIEVIDRTEKNYSVSIEKFAERVRKYIESKGDNHRVIFLVDEIGQYIGDDRALMLNLQTVVEDLGLECGGRAWVIVTSQEAIDDVIDVRGNDFSKIQGRFDTKLSLSSSDIDEVIKKRILDKKASAKESLELLYNKEESIIRNLLTFRQASHQKIYVDEKDFADTYPFIPYQFKLLQTVFTDIRTHGYAGKHLSSGERSLLGAFQETAKKHGADKIGAIIPFYAFYDTIEQFLEHQVKIVIKTAEDMVKNGVLKPEDVNVLKTLFMLKNVKEIPANIENLATLHVSNTSDDKINIKNSITDSLRRLESQTLIQRNNEEYKFLTDEEQEINREIKNIVIDRNRVTDYIKKMVFDYSYDDSRITYKNKIFPISKYVDNSKYTQDYDIGIKVISSSPEKDTSMIRMQSARENNYLFIVLEISTLIYDEITNNLKVEEYKRSKAGANLPEQTTAILNAKLNEVSKAEDRIRVNVSELIKEAEFIIAGDTVKLTNKEPKQKINEALETLINNIYTKLNYIKHNFSTKDIRELFHETSQNLLGNEVEFVNQKAYEEMKDYCIEKNDFSYPITVRSLLQDFGAAPYGFNDEDILYLLTRLLKDEVISLIYANEVQSATSEDTLNKILKREYYDRTLIKLREKVPMHLISNLKNVARNSFNVINLRDDEDGMVEDFKSKALNETLMKLKGIEGNYSYSNINYEYPGKNLVEEVVDLLQLITKVRDTSEFFEIVEEKTEQLQNHMPKIDSILEFFKGSQREQFDNAKKILSIYENNIDFIDKTEEIDNVVKNIKDIILMEEPFNDIHKLPTLRQQLIDLLAEMYDKKSKPIINLINEVITYIENETKTAKINLEFSTRYIDNCKNIIKRLETSNELKEIFAQETRVGQIKEEFFADLEIEKQKVLAGNLPEGTSVQIKVRKTIKVDQIMNQSFEINNEEDIEKYLLELKVKLQKELEENEKIIIR